MTQQEFFAYTQLHPDQVNIWYDTGGPPYTLRAITIPALDFNTPPQDRSRVLSGVQEITVPLSTGESITLKVLSATQVQSPATVLTPVVIYYYYYIVPVTLTTIGNVGIGSGTIVFSPSLDTLEFKDSPYNILEGSLDANRQSSYIMQADRYKIGTLANPTYTGPLNIAELISGSAPKAGVQDSSYTATGWINGRYEGSKTDRIDYLTEPAIAGKTFLGSEFPPGSTQQEIGYLVSSSQVLYKDFFFAGVGDTPGFSALDSKFVLSVSSPTGPTATIIRIDSGNSLTVPPALRAGDLISFEQFSIKEVIRVDSVGVSLTTPPVYNLAVTRGYFGTPQTLNTGYSVYKVDRVQIYNIIQNKLSGVPKGQVLIKETGRIVRLDSLGFVISST